MRSSIRILLTFLAGSLVGLAVPATLRAQCGVERWSVKTGTDADAGLVDLASSTPNTVATMAGWPTPPSLPANNRLQPYETTQWVLNATLTVYKLETDSDYHLVLQDAGGNTMIAEIPAPACVGSGSPFLTEIENARAEFDAVYTPTSSFQTADVPVQITGIGMFDFLHGQTGVAPNGIELHPVTNIVFNPGTTPDFSLGATPTSLSASEGASAASTISTGALGTFNSAVSLSASGLPSGVTAAFSPTSIAAPGTGSSTLTLSVGNFTAAGVYPITVTASGGGITHTTTISLTVSTAGGGGSALVNGGFESGDYTGWTTSGVTAVNNSARRSGSYGAQLGSSSPSTDSTAVQTFTLPTGSPVLSFWYANTCPDTVQYDWATATLKDNSTGVTTTILARTCTATPSWTQVSYNASASAGHSVTLTLTNHDDDYSGDPTFTDFDDVAVTTSSPGFSVSASPASVSVAQGSSGASTISTAVSGGFNNAIALSASGAPSGVTVSFNPTSIAAPGSGSSTMTMAVASSTAAGAYPITVTGSGGGLTHTATVNLTVTVPVSNVVVNGGFETGSLSSWTTSGVSAANASARHSGSFGAQLGSSSPSTTSSISQTFTLGSSSPAVSFWYAVHCPDTVTYDWATATLKDNSTGTTTTILAKTCTNTGSWVQVNYNASAQAGHSVTLTLTNHDDNYTGDATYTYFDDVVAH